MSPYSHPKTIFSKRDSVSSNICTVRLIQVTVVYEILCHLLVAHLPLQNPSNFRFFDLSIYLNKYFINFHRISHSTASTYPLHQFIKIILSKNFFSLNSSLFSFKFLLLLIYFDQFSIF